MSGGQIDTRGKIVGKREDQLQKVQIIRQKKGGWGNTQKQFKGKEKAGTQCNTERRKGSAGE